MWRCIVDCRDNAHQYDPGAAHAKTGARGFYLTALSLGGAEHRLRSGGTGSSPVGPIMELKTTSKKVLREMLRDRDRKIGRVYLWITSARAGHMRRIQPWSEFIRLDAERKQIRLAIKEYRTNG
jgi:hypothetical protein